MKAQYWIEHLRLQPHPEGGYYRETYRSALTLSHSTLAAHRGDRVASTAIYFLLSGNEFSAFHRICSDEMWHFYAGSELIVHILTPHGTYQQVHLGNNVDHGEQFQAVVPAGCWFGSSLRDASRDSYALVCCTVAPGFDFADFEMAKRRDLLTKYPPHRSIIERLTRE